MTRSRCICQSPFRDPDCVVDHERERENAAAQVEAFGRPATLLVELQRNRELLAHVAEIVSWSTDYPSEATRNANLAQLSVRVDREIRKTVAERNHFAEAA